MKKIIMYNEKETNYEVSDDGKIFNRTTGKELKGTYKTNEYHSVQLTIEHQTKTFMVHRLVAKAFCENPNNYTIVDHINGDPHDERACNLRWVTSSENALNKHVKNISKTRPKYLGDWTDDWCPIPFNHTFMINKNTTEIVNRNSRLIMTQYERNGYLRVHIGDTRFYSVHRIMWETFIGPIEDGYEIDHIDGNKKNNQLSNLRKINHQQNMANAYKNGHQGAIKIFQFDLQGNFIAEFDTIRAAAQAINGSEIAIKDASNRKGTSAGYYWLRDQDKDNILTIINSWISDGFKIIPLYPTYCINKDGIIYNKRTKKQLKPYYLSDGITRMVQIQNTRLSVDKLITETFENN